VSYRKVELARQVDEIEHNVYRECLRLCGLERDVELHAMADLPAFTGLGSSSAFTVSLLHALHSFKGEFLPPLELAYEAIHVERHLLEDRVGCQDQVMAALGGFNLLKFRGEADIAVTRVPILPARLRQFEAHLFIVFTGITRRAADLVARQIDRIPANGGSLQRMHTMVEQGADILAGSGPLEEFGELLHEAWCAKRSLEPGISSDSIDDLYSRGRAAGALGGKLLGAGGGGFLLFFVPPQAHTALRQEFAGYQLLEVKLNAPGSQIIFAG
jgi:D-glycero-alpha-D-manno-heptose-7-phosphate kinase